VKIILKLIFYHSKNLRSSIVAKHIRNHFLIFLHRPVPFSCNVYCEQPWMAAAQMREHSLGRAIFCDIVSSSALQALNPFLCFVHVKKIIDRWLFRVKCVS